MAGAPQHGAARSKRADFLRIAHRGASGECPENTLQAFRRAVELGAEMIECDLQLTADGHVVVIHDESVDRTTDGTGQVHEMTLAEIRALDAGAWRGPAHDGERIPTLEEVLDTVLPLAELNLELKGEAVGSHLVLATLLAVTRRGGLARVLFSSFDGAMLERVREASPHARIAVLWGAEPFADAWRRAGDVGAEAFHPHAGTVGADLVAEAAERGLATNVWTVNQVERVVELVAMGVSGVISDHPGRLLEARARLLAAT